MLLLLLLAATILTDEVAWGGEDFLVFGSMLALAGSTIELGARISKGFFYRAGFLIAVGTGFLLVWASLAVGVIGSEDNPVNAMYLAPLAVLLIGPAVARLKPAGMVLAIGAVALCFMAIAAIALAAGLQDAPGASAMEILGVNGLFAVLFLASAGLFALEARGAVVRFEPR